MVALPRVSPITFGSRRALVVLPYFDWYRRLAHQAVRTREERHHHMLKPTLRFSDVWNMFCLAHLDPL